MPAYAQSDDERSLHIDYLRLLFPACSIHGFKSHSFEMDDVTSRRAIIGRNPDDSQKIEMIESAWNSKPRFSDAVSYDLLGQRGRTSR